MNRPHKIPRERLDAQVELTNGRELVVTFFTAPHQRLSDLLNEPRYFLPIETSDGRMSMLARDAIRWAAPLYQAEAAGADPFRVLELPESASDDEVRANYQRLLAEYDPARIQALNLPPAFLDFAHTQRARLTDAFHRVAQQRGFYRSEAA